MVEAFAKLSLSIISMAAIIILTYSMFRIPVRGNDKQIAFIAFVVGTVNFYLKNVIDSPIFIIIQNVTFLSLLIILRGFPFLYSLIVCVTGVLCIAMIEGIVTGVAIAIGFTDMDLVLNNLLHYTLLHLIVSTVHILIAYFISKYRIGFSFVVRRFSGKNYLKAHNFIWTIMLIIGTLVLQFGFKGFNVFSTRGLVLSMLAMVLISSLIYTYFQNKKVLIDRYGGNNSKGG